MERKRTVSREYSFRHYDYILIQIILSCSREVTPPLIWYLTRTYSFNPDPATQKLLTDQELKADCGEEEYRRLVLSRIEQKKRWGLDLSPDDIKVLQSNREEATGVNAA